MGHKSSSKNGYGRRAATGRGTDSRYHRAHGAVTSAERRTTEGMKRAVSDCCAKKRTGDGIKLTIRTISRYHCWYAHHNYCVLFVNERVFRCFASDCIAPTDAHTHTHTLAARTTQRTPIHFLIFAENRRRQANRLIARAGHARDARSAYVCAHLRPPRPDPAANGRNVQQIFAFRA